MPFLQLNFLMFHGHIKATTTFVCCWKDAWEADIVTELHYAICICFREVRLQAEGGKR